MSIQQPLLDRIALVTGSGRGIGASTAMRLARAGAHLVINDISAENAQSVAREIESLGRKTLLSTHDVSNYKAAASLAEEIKNHFGRIDILVNNAGITRDAMFHKLSEDNWDEVIRINLKGPFNVGQACAKIMIQQKSGKIVNITSVALLGNIGQSNYSASKAGLLGMTKTWALELAKHGINVNAVAPGFIDTVLTQQIPTDVREKFVQKIPLKKMGRTEDIANAICFLVSDESSYITGQCIYIDGGLTTGLSST